MKKIIKANQIRDLRMQGLGFSQSEAELHKVEYLDSIILSNNFINLWLRLKKHKKEQIENRPVKLY